MKPRLNLDIPARSVAKIIGGVLFVKGAMDLIPQVSRIGSIIVGGILLWWGQRRPGGRKK
jgi:hypothetical protein